MMGRGAVAVLAMAGGIAVASPGYAAPGHGLQFVDCFIYPEMIRLMVINAGSDPQVFDPADQRLVDNRGRSFAPDGPHWHSPEYMYSPSRQLNPDEDWFGDIPFTVSGHQGDYRLVLRDAHGAVFADVPLMNCEGRP
jgi:hypothetical protein